MTQDLADRLATAVYKLTQEQPEAFSAHDDDGKFLGMHMVNHDALLRMLIDGTGNSSGKGGNGSGVPIDADAIMILASIVETLAEWDHWLPFGMNKHDVIGSLERWHTVHGNSVRDGHVSDEGERIAVETVESWQERIEKKFDPDKIIDWTDACYSCETRRMVLDDEERFAIHVNITQETAECANCGKMWVGVEGLKELRYFTNLFNERVADTPKEGSAPVVANVGAA